MICTNACLSVDTDKARQAAEKLGINESNMNLSQNISHVIAGIKSQADKLVQEQVWYLLYG